MIEPLKVDPLFGPLKRAQTGSGNATGPSGNVGSGNAGSGNVGSSGNYGSSGTISPMPTMANQAQQTHQFFMCAIPTMHGVNEFYGPFTSSTDAFLFASRYYASQPYGIFPEQTAVVVALEDPARYP